MAGGDIWYDVHLTFYYYTLSSNDMITSLRWYECVVRKDLRDLTWKIGAKMMFCYFVQHSKIVN